MQIKNSIKRQSRDRESSKKSVSSVQKAVDAEKQRNLETQVAFTEKQYSKARENNILLLKKLSEAEEMNEFLKFELDRARREREEEVGELRQELGRTRKEQVMTRERYELEEKEKETGEVIELRSRLEQKEKEMSRLHLRIKSL